MSSIFVYQAGAELPGLTLPWQEETAQNVFEDLDMTTGYTFTLTLTNGSATPVLTKTTGITGGDGFVAISWAPDDLKKPVGQYALRLRARETSTSKDRDYSPGDLVRIRITIPEETP